jgi:hypothetical protein
MWVLGRVELRTVVPAMPVVMLHSSANWEMFMANCEH